MSDLAAFICYLADSQALVTMSSTHQTTVTQSCDRLVLTIMAVVVSLSGCDATVVSTFSITINTQQWAKPSMAIIFAAAQHITVSSRPSRTA